MMIVVAVINIILFTILMSCDLFVYSFVYIVGISLFVFYLKNMNEFCWNEILKFGDYNLFFYLADERSLKIIMAEIILLYLWLDGGT